MAAPRDGDGRGDHAVFPRVYEPAWFAHPRRLGLFADLVGFSALARQRSPNALVQLLDDVFSRFDEAADRLGLEKISQRIAGVVSWSDGCV